MTKKTDDPILIRRMVPKNLLSFGPDNGGIELKPLNLFIGPNGSGKSNLVEAVNLMRAAPRDNSRNFRDVMTRKGGGVAEWIWKGGPDQQASMEWVVNNTSGRIPIRHSFSFYSHSQTLTLEDECVEETEPRYASEDDVYFFYRYQQGRPIVNKLDGGEHRLSRETIEPNLSVLAQLRDPENYPELVRLARSYERIRIYREWTFGRNSVFRDRQDVGGRNDVLEEDFSNLGLFLNRLMTRFPKAKRELLSALKDLYEGIHDLQVLIDSGSVQVFLTEGDFVIPATRLSDGTLRYLCLLAILLDPEPPPLICIEEPEIGLHPDILPKLADWLKYASKHTQLIVTTHSDILIDAMTETPECVVVCEKHDGKTEMNRLSSEELEEWLDKYRLGQLWIDGQIGGKRW